uniref:Uncharacterized protein n=1 Tax=Halteria grandinella TaxID=5974 RepID=A0A7T0M4R1_HALGN|nr:hypothetical protein J6764_mgp10 [Halteria grandinella]QPL16005.1 hypothetical protein [Halteria grandinella]
MIISKIRYSNKNLMKIYIKKNSKIKNKPILLNFSNKKEKIKQNQIYYPIYSKTYFDTYFNFNFEIYTNQFSWIKLNFLNLNYIKLLDLIKIKLTKIKYTNKNKLKIINFEKFNQINLYIYNYNYLFHFIKIELFYFYKMKYNNKLPIIYFLSLAFKNNKLFLNLNNNYKKSYISLSTGLFIKFFENKKSFKKNKTIKLLMAKYIRKVFLITKIVNTILFIKKTPKILNEIINFFNLPIAHKFLNPIENKSIEEHTNNFIWIKFLYFIFIENKSFCKNKLAQKGRIKRKILRKITFENKIID